MSDISSLVSVSEDQSKPTLNLDDPPLVSLKVANPIIYFKNWWKRLIGNEGIEMKWSLKIKPLTAFFLFAFVISGGVTLNLLNRLRKKTPVVGEYIPAFGAENLQERAFTENLEVSSKGAYFLITATEMVGVSAKSIVPLGEFAGEKIFVTGKYNKETKILVIEEVKVLDPAQQNNY